MTQNRNIESTSSSFTTTTTIIIIATTQYNSFFSFIHSFDSPLTQ